MVNNVDVTGGPGPCFSRVKLNPTALNRAVCKVSKPINIRTYAHTYVHRLRYSYKNYELLISYM